MKTKELFKALEAANFVASTIDRKRCHIEADALTRDYMGHSGYTLQTGIRNARDYTFRFRTWNEFAASVACDFHEDVCTLIAKGALRRTDTLNSFVLSDEEISDQEIMLTIYED